MKEAVVPVGSETCGAGAPLKTGGVYGVILLNYA